MNTKAAGARFVECNVRLLCELIGGQCAAARALEVSDRTMRRWAATGTAPMWGVSALTKAAAKASRKSQKKAMGASV